MKHKNFRDILYDYNDLIIAVIILVIASLVIFWRVNVIMAYPKTVAKTSKYTSSQEVKQATAEEEKNVNENKTEADTIAVWENGMLSSDVQVKCDTASKPDVIERLVSAGMYESDVEFRTICKAAKVSPDNVKTNTTFIFPKGTTKESAAKIIAPAKAAPKKESDD